MDEERQGGLEDNLDIEPERPVLDIPNVFLYAFLHLPQFLGLTTATIHLGIAGDAGTTEMAHHVLVDDVAVLFGVGKHMRTGTDDAHVAFQHVEELRELVDVGLADEVAEGKFSRVVLGGL